MKKLSLNRETIRNLDEKDLEKVHGAIPCTGPKPESCPYTHLPNGALCVPQPIPPFTQGGESCAC